MADRAFDWNDTIENDSSYILLPEGTYPFTVIRFERGEHAGSDGIPPCKKMVLTLELDGGELGVTEITENLYLHSRQEWKLCRFFTCIGLRKPGEAYKMDWNAVPRARGVANIIIHNYKNKNNQMRKINRVSEFLDPANVAAPSAPLGNGFTPGAF